MSNSLKYARDVIHAEISGLTALADSLDESFMTAVDLILKAQNYLIVVGVGKSGHIGQKIAASFASTGTYSFFMHPTEASHGDLGMVKDGSVILAISNSGESRELRDVLQYAQRNNIAVIGITKDPCSTLAQFSQTILRLPATAEACPNGIAPTTSTTNTLALGDALVVATMIARGFTIEDFGKRHPGGKIGMRLQTVEEWLAMHPKNTPSITLDTAIDEVVTVISKGGQGCAAVMNGSQMAGIITDGDLRRAMDEDFLKKTAKDVMTTSPFTLSTSMRISHVIDAFTKKRISNAFIVKDGRPLGVIDMKSLLEEGYL